jgi:hypothetical protein
LEPSRVKRFVDGLSARIGGPAVESRAFQVTAMPEGSKMLVRTYQPIAPFDRAVTGLP